MERATNILRAVTILLGAATTATLAFQVAMIGAMDIAYWDTGDASSGWSIWCGVAAVGLLLGATILVPHMPRVSAVTYLACLPLAGLYELDQNRNFSSLEISESIAMWIVLAIIGLATTSWLSSSEGQDR
jgi:hypothetical protein